MRVYKPLFLTLAIFVLLVSAYVRLHSITQIGISGSDSIFYTSMAKQWSNGNSAYNIGCSKEIYRPVIFQLYSWALQLFGEHDYSIKLLNVLTDLVNIILILAIGYLIFESWLVALGSSAVYSLIPRVVDSAKSELVHITSAFFLLSVVLTFLLAEKSNNKIKKYLLLFASGVFLGVSAGAHEDLLFINFGILVYFLTRDFGSFRQFIKNILQNSVESLAFFLPMLGSLLFYDINSMLFKHSHRVTGLASSKHEGKLFFFETVYGFIVRNTSVYMLVAVVLTAVVMLVFPIIKRQAKSLRERNIQNSLQFLFLVVFSHTAVFSLVMTKVYPRIFIPFLGLMILFILGALHLFFINNKKTYRLMIISGVVLFFVYSNLYSNIKHPLFAENSKYYSDARPRTFKHPYYKMFLKSDYKAIGRKVFDQLGRQVNKGQKLLVTPHLAYPFSGRRIYQTYFNDNVIYVLDEMDLPFRKIIDKYNIKFVLVLKKRWDYRVLLNGVCCQYTENNKWVMAEAKLGRVFGLPEGDYSPEKELSYLFQAAEAEGWKTITENKAFNIYELP